MRKALGLSLAVVTLAVLVFASGAAMAEDGPIQPRPITPIPCVGLSIYDLDGSGKVDSADFETWVRRVHWGADACALNGPASACPIWVDVNGDGKISHADLDALLRFMISCAGPPRASWPPR